MMHMSHANLLPYSINSPFSLISAESIAGSNMGFSTSFSQVNMAISPASLVSHRFCCHRLMGLPAVRLHSDSGNPDIVHDGDINGSEGSVAKMNERPKIVVLHPFPTSWEFIKEATGLGFEVWATDPGDLKLPEDVSAVIKGYLKSSVYDADAVAEEVKGFEDMRMFYPGSEMAVLSAAELSEKFGLPGNPVDVAWKTRYKDLMRKALQELVPDHNPMFAIIKKESDLEAAAQKIGFPAVFKRTDFAGSFGVKLIHDIEGLKEYYREQASISELPFGQAVRPIYLLEEYVEGQEYSVEAVTIDGVTTVLGVTKKGVGPAPYFVEAKHEFPAQFFGTPMEQVEAMSRLTKEVTEALGLRFCVSHFEVRWDPVSDSPKIIELASRTGGGQIPELLREVIGIYGWSPMLSFLCDMSADKSLMPSSVEKSASVQFVFAGKSGVFKGISFLDEIRRHPSHRRDNITYQTGREIMPTDSYKDRIAYFIGSSSSADEIRSYQRLVHKARAIIESD